jgi:hypothetical protein
MMRAAVIVNPATTDVPVLWEQVGKTLTAAGWSTTVWLETTPTGGVSTRGSTAAPWSSARHSRWRRPVNRVRSRR